MQKEVLSAESHSVANFQSINSSTKENLAAEHCQNLHAQQLNTELQQANHKLCLQVRHAKDAGSLGTLAKSQSYQYRSMV